jgi:uncharacterized membrane protein
MESLFLELAAYVELAIEALVVLLLAWAVLEAAFGLLRAAAAGALAHEKQHDARIEIWFRFALWIVLALELLIAADIIRSAISPSWDSIAQLAAISAIRTGLNWFLMRDIDAYREKRAGVANDG